MTNGAAPRWQVTNQVETTRPDQNGKFVDGVLVSYVMANGTTGSVFLPRHSYNVDAVRAAIEAEVANHEQIAGLTG